MTAFRTVAVRVTSRPRLAPLACALLTAGAVFCGPRPGAAQTPEHAHIVPAAPAPAPQPPADQQPAAPAGDPGSQGQAPAPAAQPAAPAQAPSAQPSAPAQAPAAPAPAPAAAPPPSSTPPPASKPAPPPARTSAPPAAPPGPLFGEQIEVRVVNLEAVVTDKKGNRVPDLTPQDFRLKVDGKPAKIDFFNEVRGGQAIAVAPGSGSETIPGLPDLAPGSPVGTSYLVFIDDYFSIAARRNEVLRSLKDDLARLGPEDRMALIAYDGRHLNMLSSWSSSVHDLGRAIDIELGNPAQGLQRAAELRQFDDSKRHGPSTTDIDSQARNGFARSTLSVEEEGFVYQLASQVEESVGAAVSTLRAFAAPPGRKVMLLLCGGWPYSPVDYAVNSFNRTITDRTLPNGDQVMKPLIDTANRLGYTLYPVDVPGLETEAATATTDFQPPGLATTFGLREKEHEGSLTHLAEQTGGKAMLNSLRIASLEHVEADTRSYYWLGFTPAWQGNDKSHKVELEVLRKDLTVRTRDSFLDRSRKSDISMMVESAMLFGPPAGAATMPVQLGTPVKASKRGQMEVPVTLAIPTAAFTTVPLNGKFAAELELRVAAQDEHGDRSDIPVIPLTLQSDKAPVAGRYVRFQTRLTVRHADQHLIFAIFDPLSNKITTAEADLKAY